MLLSVPQVPTEIRGRPCPVDGRVVSCSLSAPPAPHSRFHPEQVAGSPPARVHDGSGRTSSAQASMVTARATACPSRSSHVAWDARRDLLTAQILRSRRMVRADAAGSVKDSMVGRSRARISSSAPSAIT